jgi:hypothetical protein
MIALVLFLKLIFHGMLLRVIQRLHFWTKFCILLTLMISWVHLCVSKSWVPKYLSTNPLGSKTQTSLSPLSYVGWIIRDGEHELWQPRSFTWSDWDTDGSPYPCSWHSIARAIMWHLHLLCEHSHTLSPTLTYNVKFVYVLTWSL